MKVLQKGWFFDRILRAKPGEHQQGREWIGWTKALCLWGSSLFGRHSPPIVWTLSLENGRFWRRPMDPKAADLLYSPDFVSPSFITL